MARFRTIKPEFWTDSKTGTLSGLATKLFIGLLNYSDDFGVCPLDVFELKARILPYEPGVAVDVISSLLLEELLPRRLVVLVEYSTNVRRTLLWIPNFIKHQKVDKPGSPVLPGWNRETTPDNYEGDVTAAESLTDAAELIRRTIGEYSTNVRVREERKGEESKVEITTLSGKSPTDLSLPKTKRTGLSEQVSQVFNYWRERCDHPKAQLDTKRYRSIERQLKSGRSVEDLHLAIEGARHDPFSQGVNDRGRKFDDISLICRDAEHVEKFIAIAKSPGRSPGQLGGNNGIDNQYRATNRTVGAARGRKPAKPQPLVG